MSTQVTTAYVNEYKSNVELLLQQQGSLLESSVRVESQMSEFDYYDRIGATAAQRKTGRHSDTPLMNTPHDRRQVGLEDYEWADLIDKQDKLRTAKDLTSPYVQNAAFAMGRAKDDEIIAAFFGSAKSGKTGSTTVSFPSAQQVGVDYVESGATTNSGLTIAKLRRARTILRSGQVQKTEQMFIAVTARQIQDLLQTTQVTSSDYNVVKALVQGDIDTFMGFKFIEIERLATDANSYRRIPVWAKSGMLLAVGAGENAMQVDIGPRRDKGNSTQIYVCGSFGSTRMEEGKVVEIKCSEA